MIQINLLGIKKEVAKSRMPSVSMEGAKATVLLVAILVIAVGALGYHYTRLMQEADQLSKDIAKAEDEQKRLARVKSEYDEFEKRRQLLTKKINIIEGLKKAQTGPVTMLNVLAATVETSGALWLTSFETEGGKISMNGVANNVNTVADFISNLKRSGQFKNVEIKESFEDDRLPDLSTFVFSISAELVPPGPPAGSKT